MAIILGCCLFIAGIAIGWRTSRRLTIPASLETQRAYLATKGDAPDAVRAEVLNSLRAFQDGYSKRDPQRIDDFMQKLFVPGDDTRLIATDAEEWRNGSKAVAELIRGDWRGWGDLGLAVDDSAISSLGDVAWLATTGHVRFTGYSRPVRFTAVLTHRDGRWLFRQIQFQWDERLATFSDLKNSKVRSQITSR